MDKINYCRILFFAVFILLLPGLTRGSLDAPHNASSPGAVGCLSCHDLTSSEPKLLPAMGHSPQNMNDTLFNNICWSCHNGGGAPYAATHSSLTTDNGYGNWSVECWVCHNQHTQEQDRYNGSTYGKFIRRSIALDNISGLSMTGTKAVRFLGPTGPNSFADGDGSYDGICEVCHTRTTHFRNDGSGQDQLHSNINGGQAGVNCITCHNHINGFTHGGPGTGCGDCHGDDPKHLVHLAIIEDCGSCHNVNYFPAFTSGTDTNGDGYYNLTETDVCNTCHKDGAGANPAVTASEYKPGWHDDLFDIDCSGCHGYAPDYVNGSPKINSHTRHETYGFSCEECHYNTTNNGTTISDTALHINDVYDVTFQNVDINYNSAGHTCNNTYCHSNGVGGTANTGDPRPVQENTSSPWGASGPLACDSCHGFPPDYPNSNFQFDFKTNAHKPHQFFSCSVCHYDTTTNGSSITSLGNHLNGHYDVAPDQYVELNYVYGGNGGTCSSIVCHAPYNNHHSGSTRVWTYGGGNSGGNIYLSSEICYGVTIDLNVSGTYRVDWGDGTAPVEGSGPIFFHQYPPYAGSTYYAEVYAGSSQNPDILSISPQDVNTNPVAARSIAVDGYSLTLTDLSYDSDYNTCGHSGTGIITIHWGDGTTTLTSIDLTDTPSSLDYSHTYPTLSTRTYTIQHYVTDNSGKKIGGNTGAYTVPQFPPLNLSGRVTRPDGSGVSGRMIYLWTTSHSNLGGVYTNATGYYDFGDVSGYGEECYMVEPNQYQYYTPNRYNNICETRSDLNFVYD